MKHYVLFHNIITMTMTSIKNSVEGFTPGEVEEIKDRLKNELNESYLANQLTVYQFTVLSTLINAID